MIKRIFCMTSLLYIVVGGRTAMANVGIQVQQAEMKTVSFKNFGVSPSCYRNATPALVKALTEIEDNTILIFPKGRYDFWPVGAKLMELYVSNNSDINPKKVIAPIVGKKNIVIDGQGSEFIYHDQVMPFEILNSTKITFKNFSMDWQRPITSQGKITKIDKHQFEMQFLPESWYEVRNKRLIFYGENWGSQAWGNGQPHDDVTGRIKYQSTGALGLKINFGKIDAVDLGHFTVRFTGAIPKNYKLGDVVNFRSQDRNNVGIHISQSTNTVIESIDMHYACAMGIVGQRATDITIRKFRIIKPKGSGRRFTTFADATHFSGCRGLITVEDSYFEHMHDDAINVHGTYVQIVERLGDRAIKVKYMHGQSKTMLLAEKGDECQFINHETMLPYQRLKVISFKITDDWHAIINFEDSIPKQMKIKDGIENITWTPEVIFRRNKIVHNRARGMLFNTPRKTVVEDNYIQTAGSAILVAGDCNYWFESGSVGTYGSLVIRNNVFEDCLTNLYQFTNAQISVDPLIPKFKKGGKCYHRGIVIENNTFKVFDAPILFARSVNGIVFKKNTIERTYTFKPYHGNKDMFRFESCKQVEIKENRLIGDVLGKNIRLIKMNNSALDADSIFTVK